MWGFRKRTADFVIAPHGEAVMSRWYLIPRNRWFNLYVHRLDRADPQSLHDHPWWNISILLKGRRWEYVPDSPPSRYEAQANAHPSSIESPAWLRKFRALRYQMFRKILRRPGSIVFRHAVDAHRLETIGGPSYSLFVTGPVVREWGFWLPTGWVLFKDYVEVVDGVSRQKV